MKTFVKWRENSMSLLGKHVLLWVSLRMIGNALELLKFKSMGSRHFLKKLFVIMLLSGTIKRLAHVWNQTWTFLSYGILHKQRDVANNSGFSNFFVLLLFTLTLTLHLLSNLYELI